MEFASLFKFCFYASIFSIFLFSSPVKFFNSSSQKLPLPPDSLGWPYIGETFQLYSQNPNVFFAEKRKRYGSVFKTHILGCPCVMVSSPEAMKFVLVTKAHLFKPTFPASKERMLGKQAIFFHQGDYHAKLRKLVLRAFMPQAIKNIVPSIESTAKDSLQSMEGRLINTFQEMKTFTFNVALLSIFGKDEVLYTEDLKRCYYILEKGYSSLPIKLPGTIFYKSMKARKELAQILAIPVGLTALPLLTTLLLDQNQFSSSLPSHILSWKSLTTLNLSRNAISEQIPEEFGSLPGLTDFDLSENQLSGQIPLQLGLMKQLGSLNLSSNHLTGKIPNEIENDAYASSFLNNPRLCANSPSLNIPKCNSKPQNSSKTSSTLLASIIDLVIEILLVSAASFFMVRNYLKKKHGMNFKWELSSLASTSQVKYYVVFVLLATQVTGTMGSTEEAEHTNSVGNLNLIAAVLAVVGAILGVVTAILGFCHWRRMPNANRGALVPLPREQPNMVALDHLRLVVVGATLGLCHWAWRTNSNAVVPIPNPNMVALGPLPRVRPNI